MLAEHDRRADAFARLTATFPLHDVTDVFAKQPTLRDRSVLTASTLRQTHVPDSGLDTVSLSEAADAASKPKRMVEPDGIEPTTSCLQSTRSPS